MIWDDVGIKYLRRRWASFRMEGAFFVGQLAGREAWEYYAGIACEVTAYTAFGAFTTIKTNRTGLTK